jgi:hypothetical protein
LANLLHVEYVLETNDSPLTSWQHVLPEIVFPKDLYERLKEAAEIASVTELTSYLKEIESLGEAGQRLAEQMRTPIRNYDLETILKLVSEICVETTK